MIVDNEDHRSAGHIPLKARRRALGVLSLSSDGSNAFARPLKVIDAIKASLGALLENTALMESLERERATGERRDNFISIASHELRTPLSIILNYAHFLGTVAPLEGEAAVALRRIEEAGRVQADLLDHLLAADALQSNRYRLSSGPVDLRDVISEAVSLAKATTERHAITADVDPEAAHVFGDREGVFQVVMNLLSNAVKYSPEGGAITVQVSMRGSGRRAVVCVSDHGIGLAPEHRRELLQKFYRVRRPETTNIPGAGLGLYISAEIMRRMKGRLWVRSKLDEGSSFYLSLPVVPKEDASARKTPVAASGGVVRAS